MEPLPPARPVQDQVASRKNQISPRNNSNFSKDFNCTNVSPNESRGFRKGVGAGATFTVPAGKEGDGPRLIGRLFTEQGASAGSQSCRGLLSGSLEPSPLAKGLWQENPGRSPPAPPRRTRAIPQQLCVSGARLGAQRLGGSGCEPRPRGAPGGKPRKPRPRLPGPPPPGRHRLLRAWSLGPGPAEGATGRCPQGAGGGRRRCPALLQASLSVTALFSARPGRALGESQKAKDTRLLEEPLRKPFPAREAQGRPAFLGVREQKRPQAGSRRPVCSSKAPSFLPFNSKSFFFKAISTPHVGLELTTPRSSPSTPPTEPAGALRPRAFRCGPAARGGGRRAGRGAGAQAVTVRDREPRTVLQMRTSPRFRCGSPCLPQMCHLENKTPPHPRPVS